MLLTVRLIVSCVVCIMLSEINDYVLFFWATVYNDEMPIQDMLILYIARIAAMRPFADCDATLLLGDWSILFCWLGQTTCTASIFWHRREFRLPAVTDMLLLFVGWNAAWWTDTSLSPAVSISRRLANINWRRVCHSLFQCFWLALIFTRSARVCLCVTSWYCIKTAKHRITQATPRDSPGTLVFWRQNSCVGIW